MEYHSERAAKGRNAVADCVLSMAFEEQESTTLLVQQ